MGQFQRKKLPVDSQAFEIMRGENYLYVDKTRHIYQMIAEGRFYFLSRPRRFGKSLLVSTLKCLFQGRKGLFEGLWIAEHGEWNWQEHPVVVLGFNEISGRTPEILEQSLNQNLKDIAEHFAISLKSEILELRFKELIVRLHQKTGTSVVVLIDEYDKPIVDHLGKGPRDLKTARANRDLLKSFFGVLKGVTVSPILRFVFLTGISRFSKVSIFSELNNLLDMSMEQSYADLLGYTRSELLTYFHEYIEQFAAESTWSPEQVTAKLARHYDGYRFSERDIRVYNPFSVLRAFRHQEFQDYWFESATPTFLTNLLRQSHYNLPGIEGLRVSRSIFNTFDLDRLQPEALLFQSGYLTITDVQSGIYTLDYPNHEV
ncbi:MAG: AAA family ATPase, partial [bacterium]|nr:AAA family ATPase [bacterium]